SATFGSVNRNKKSVILDLKSDDGVAAARALAETADVLIENYRVGTMDRLGLSYEYLIARNPRLVYCSVTAFGLTGSDVFHVTPSEDTVMFLDGGNAFIDTLNFSAPGLMVHQSRFLLMTEGRQDVVIINFENVLIDGIVTPNAADHWQFYE
ncbi:MAG: CoA transferase, partial [Chloroflexi bacterium]|nr:CoA transferase [Chloroflexota bacterium]